MKLTIPILALTVAMQMGPLMYAQAADTDDYSKHAVFVMTNSEKGNEVLAYARAKDGSLIEREHYGTGGRGSGGTTDPLGSQGSLTLSQDRSLLFAVNAASGTISVFRVWDAKLERSQVIRSGGSAPVTVAQHGNLVYVVNFAGNSNVVGFELDEAGYLSEIPNSIRYLSAANSGPSSIAFSPDGRFLLVTEKVTNNIDVFTVQGDGSLSSKPNVTTDPVPGLFDVVFSPEGAALIVQTGPAGSSNESSISSYLVEEGGTLSPVTASVPLLGTGSCWIALTPGGRFAFTANSASSTISGLAIGSSGIVTALPGTVVASLPAGSLNLDIALSGDSKYVYTLNSGTGTIGALWIRPDHTLKLVGLVPGLRANSGYQGLAAF